MAPRQTPPVAEPIQMSPSTFFGLGATTLMRPVTGMRPDQPGSGQAWPSLITSGPRGTQELPARTAEGSDSAARQKAAVRADSFFRAFMSILGGPALRPPP